MSLPQTLGETYMRILTNVPEYNRRNATRILQFLTFSQRPLRINELVDVIAVDLEHEPSFDIRSRMPVPMEILRCCSSLVAFSEETREIRLAHFSVKEFMTSQEDKGVFTQSLEEFTAHESIIEVIVAYLLSITNTGLESNDLKATYHLVDYCARHWIDHAEIVEENSASTRQRLLELFSNKGSWFVCNKIYNPGDPDNKWTDEVEWPDSVAEPLYIASLGGLKYLVKDLLQQGADIDAVTGEEGTALHVACKEGHSDIARVLIESGADINIVGDFSKSTILLAAMQADLIDISCLLINHGADSGAQGNIWSVKDQNSYRREIYPLHAACFEGADKVVKALINKNVDINLDDEHYGTPLEIASSSGNEKVVKLLCEQGAETGTCALHEAVLNHHEHIVQLLLEHGADVNVRNKKGDTPLGKAVGYHLEDNIRLLLEHGADVHARDRAGGTLLHTAVQTSASEGVILLLFKHGVDAHVQNQMGEAPLQLAERWGYKQMAQLLRTAEGAALPSSSSAQKGIIGGRTSSA